MCTRFSSYSISLAMKMYIASLLVLLVVIYSFTEDVLGESEGTCECAVFMHEKLGGWQPGDQMAGNGKDCAKKSLTDLANLDSNTILTNDSDSTSQLMCDPLSIQVPDMLVVCDDDGMSLCKEVCSSMAMEVKSQFPELLCDLMGTNTEQMKPALFFRTCSVDDANMWLYSGLTYPQPICCKDGKSVQCETTSANN